MCANSNHTSKFLNRQTISSVGHPSADVACCRFFQFSLNHMVTFRSFKWHQEHQKGSTTYSIQPATYTNTSRVPIFAVVFVSPNCAFLPHLARVPVLHFQTATRRRTVGRYGRWTRSAASLSESRRGSILSGEPTTAGLGITR